MRLTDDLPPSWILIKGALFAVLAGFGSIAIVLIHPELLTAVLLAMTLWAACRTYYFLFYVIERYVDPNFRFAGLGSLLKWLWARRKS